MKMLMTQVYTIHYVVTDEKVFNRYRRWSNWNGDIRWEECITEEVVDPVWHDVSSEKSKELEMIFLKTVGTCEQ